MQQEGIKKRKLDVLRIPRHILEICEIEFSQSPDNDTFSCVTELHYLLNLSQESVRLRLVSKLLEIIKNKDYCEKELYERIKKGELADFIIHVYEECKKNGDIPDKDKACQWIYELFGASFTEAQKQFTLLERLGNKLCALCVFAVEIKIKV